jgi:hypothetical protein
MAERNYLPDKRNLHEAVIMICDNTILQLTGIELRN